MNLIIHPIQELYGTLTVPGDKSISHRAVMFAALAEGQSQVRNFLPGGDCRATLGVMRALGVPITEVDFTTLQIDGLGLAGLQEPAGAVGLRQLRHDDAVDGRFVGRPGFLYHTERQRATD